MFGYEKGAFTGAVINKPGRFEIAHEGTLFLDEIGEMPLHLQAKLLGVLQDSAFERVGGVKTIKVDLRLITATNIDLHAAVEASRFRSDLFYRLHVVPIHIPALRERKDDIMLLSDYFLRKFRTKYQKKVNLAPEATAALINYKWPGNIRELENVMEHMIVMSEGEILGPEQLPGEVRGIAKKIESSALKEKIDGMSHAAEKQMIIEALDKTAQNRTKAAELLGISRRTLQNKIKEYKL